MTVVPYYLGGGGVGKEGRASLAGLNRLSDDRGTLLLGGGVGKEGRASLAGLNRLSDDRGTLLLGGGGGWAKKAGPVLQA